MNSRLRRSIVILALLAVGVLWLFPIFMAFINSFKTRAELFTDILALPARWNLDNYWRSFSKMHYFRSFLNTVGIAAVGLAGMVFFSSLAGWVMCRIKTRLSTILFSLFVFSMLVPFNAVMIPLYQVAKTLSLQNSIAGLGIIYIGLGTGMAVFMYHGFMKAIPLDLEDAAAIDGCSILGTYRHVVFPLLIPTTATIVIMNLLWIWNDFLLPLIMLQSSKKYTLLLSTNMLFGQYASDWPAILSALLLAVLPVLVIYLLLQKNIVKGIADGALKG